MTTLPATEAAGKLPELLQRAIAGEEIGIEINGHVISLRVDDDEGYAFREYGVTPAELDAFAERMDAQIEADRKAGKYKEYKGDIEALLED